nr:hypothetical protein [Tanacetum cinerariifolium]
AKVVNIASYIQNRALVVKPHNKTPYELFRGKFDGKSDDGFFVGYSLNSKDFRAYNTRIRKVEENLHIRLLEDKPRIAGTNSDDFADGSPLFDSSLKLSDDVESPSSGDAGKKHDKVSDKESGALNELNYAFENLNIKYPDDLKMPILETIATYDVSKEEADFTNLEYSIHVSPTPTTKVH